jgi:hypothetical protein
MRIRARAYAQQQYDRFQHDRITPLAQACAPAVKLSLFSSGQCPDETIFRSRRKRSETKGRVFGCQRNRIAAMQFIFELIWNRSRSRFLAAMGEPEAGE